MLPEDDPWTTAVVGEVLKDSEPNLQPLPRMEKVANAPAVVGWPDPLNEAALYGLAGDIVRAIDPHTESDPVAVLAQIIVGFGNMIGRSSHFEVDAARHYTNLDVVLVGSTAKGRKGTSASQALRTLAAIDENWRECCVNTGLSSGEGLIWAVRNPVIKQQPLKERGGRVTGYQDVEEDPGVEDKRLLVLESEFASTLKVMAREGNTLSTVIRQAWDSGALNSMVKNSKNRATDAHISIIGHITKEELRRNMDSTETANGFANRFLWLCVQRSKCLPHGGNLKSENLAPHIFRMQEATDFARKTGIVRFDPEASTRWEAVYPALSQGGIGMFGAVTSRAESQVYRLAMMYALLDCSAVIQSPHLVAALALWEYAEGSARFIFGDATGDPVADEILRALRATGDGLSRTDISALFGRHKKSDQIGRALVSLQENGLTRRVTERTDGRSIERWISIGA